MISVKRLILITTLILAPLAAAAVESESDEPVYIESNTATYNEATGESVYVGDVIVTQGGMTMWSEKLTIYMTEQEIEKIVAVGKPVKFKQDDPDGKEAMNGHSLIMEYYMNSDTVVLLKEAVVNQVGNVYASERIEYDRKNLLIKAGTPNSAKERVHVVLKPKKAAGAQ